MHAACMHAYMHVFYTRLEIIRTSPLNGNNRRLLSYLLYYGYSKCGCELHFWGTRREPSWRGCSAGYIAHTRAQTIKEETTTRLNGLMRIAFNSLADSTPSERHHRFAFEARKCIREALRIGRTILPGRL